MSTCRHAADAQDEIFVSCIYTCTYIYVHVSLRWEEIHCYQCVKLAVAKSPRRSKNGSERLNLRLQAPFLATKSGLPRSCVALVCKVLR